MAYHAEWQKHLEDDKIHEVFKKTRAQCFYLSRTLHGQYLLDVQYNIKTNIKFYWNYVNSMKSNKSSIFPKSMNFDNITSNNDFDSSNLFSKFFSAVYTDKLMTFLIS